MVRPRVGIFLIVSPLKIGGVNVALTGNPNVQLPNPGFFQPPLYSLVLDTQPVTVPDPDHPGATLSFDATEVWAWNFTFGSPPQFPQSTFHHLAFADSTAAGSNRRWTFDSGGVDNRIFVNLGTAALSQQNTLGIWVRYEIETAAGLVQSVFEQYQVQFQAFTV